MWSQKTLGYCWKLLFTCRTPNTHNHPPQSNTPEQRLMLVVVTYCRRWGRGLTAVLLKQGTSPLWYQSTASGQAEGRRDSTSRMKMEIFPQKKPPARCKPGSWRSWKTLAPDGAYPYLKQEHSHSSASFHEPPPKDEVWQRRHRAHLSPPVSWVKMSLREGISLSKKISGFC